MEMNEIKPQSLLSIPHYRILSIVAATSGLGWMAWLLVVHKLDPYESTSLALVLFFLSLIMALSGTFASILFFMKKWRSSDDIYVKHVMISLRQGILLSTCTALCLALLMFGMLRIWNGSLIVMLMMLMEFYLSGKDDLN